MSFPRHPKGEAITKMLLEMRSNKYIASTLRVDLQTVRNQAERLGFLKLGLTRDERLWLAAKRGIDPKLAP